MRYLIGGWGSPSHPLHPGHPTSKQASKQAIRERKVKVLWFQWYLLFDFRFPSTASAKLFIIHVVSFFFIIITPRLTEKSITQADGNRLGLSVVGQRSLAELSSDT